MHISIVCCTATKGNPWNEVAWLELLVMLTCIMSGLIADMFLSELLSMDLAYTVAPLKCIGCPGRCCQCLASENL